MNANFYSLLCVGDSAFRQWTYTIKYSLLGSMDEVVFNTTELMATLTNLNPGSLYEMSISVSGPGGELMAEEALVFSTELPGKKEFAVHFQVKSKFVLRQRLIGYYNMLSVYSSIGSHILQTINV